MNNIIIVRSIILYQFYINIKAENVREIMIFLEVYIIFIILFIDDLSDMHQIS